jgi:hypothetical protein
MSEHYEFSSGKVKRAGKLDGRNWSWKFWPFAKKPHESRPPQDQETPCEYEKAIKEGAETDIRRIAGDWEKVDDKLRPPYARVLAQIKECELRYPKESKEAQQAKRTYEKADSEFHKLLPPSLKPVWMFFWLGFLGLIEFPINSIVFSIFGEGKLLTYVFALIIILIPLGAHWLGHFLRQETKDKWEWVLIISVSIIILATLIGFGFVRGQYLAAVLSKFTSLKIAISPTMATMIFLVFNLAIFIITSFISYSGTHPQHRLYSQKRSGLKSARLVFEKESGEEEDLAKRLADLRERLAEAKDHREKHWRWHIEKANEDKETAEFYISLYRTANLKARPTATPPKCFLAPPLSPEIPKNLTNIEWDFKEAGAA